MITKGTTAADTNYEKKTSSELKRIADSVNHMKTGFKTLKVELVDPENNK